MTMDCPAGWTLLTENEGFALVANFRLGPGVTTNTRAGQGKATIAVSNMPRLYRTFSEWIYAAHKNAPDAVQKRLNVTNAAGASVPVIWMSSPDGTSLPYSSYFFQVDKNPVLVELNYRADDTKRDEYIYAAKAMIAGAKAAR